MSHKLEIKEGAFFISDAHYSHKRPELLGLIKAIDADTLSATQLILMGDIFDALFGGVDTTIQNNKEIIELINNISKKTEVIYLEGNHDFKLSKIFPNTKVFSIKQQPLLANFHSKKVLLSHGDFDGTLAYRFYTSIVRNSITIFFLNTIDTIFNHIILSKLDHYLAKKDDCKEFVGFEEFAKDRVATKHDCHFFIDGHFHQNKSFDFKELTYINLGAFACNQRYFVVKSSNEQLLLEEKIFSKEI